MKRGYSPVLLRILLNTDNQHITQRVHQCKLCSIAGMKAFQRSMPGISPKHPK